MRQAAACLVCVAVAAAQQQSLPQVPTVTFQANSQLVVEIVTVKDRSGNTIENLTAKDFVLTENGVPQTISFCEFQKLAAPVPEPVPSPGVPRPAVSSAVARVTPNEISP